MGPGLLDGFRRVLSAIGFVDLGKRWRRAAFRVGSACETAQKSQTGACGRQGRGSKRCEAGRIRGAQGVRRVPKGVPCAGGLTSVNRGRRCVHFRTHLRPLFMYDCNRTSRRHARLMRGSLRAGEGGPLPADSCCLAVARHPGTVELRIRVQKRRRTLPHAVCVRSTI